MRILVTRPAEDAASFAQALVAKGHTPIVSPALEILPSQGPPIDTAPYAAVLITSANAVRALSLRSLYLTARLICVGPASAAAARAAGFQNVVASSGDGVAGLLAAIPTLVAPADGPLFYPSAEEVAGDLESALTGLGYRVTRQVFYRAARATRLTPEAETALRGGALDAVTYFSVRSVAGTRQAVRAHGLEPALQKIPAICLSPAIATAAASIAARCMTAEIATEAAMLDCLAQTGP